ncbi:hypothetical protein [Longimicrobium sp.]|uniref:hypothetical protein n=1 Tax=Longimicrobium sp. TaxID=2029185 RepID=UPI002C09A596|nr:hypothetical protein [Longimicrobium sp.]HSU15920.1 hypothetical protein [Longimicrobium sp.]
MRTRSLIRRGAFAAVVAASLGFGAAQATATPAKSDAGFRGCSQNACDMKCAKTGQTGFCDGRGCRCL